MNIKILLCHCKGLCPSFKDADMDTLPFMVECELDVEDPLHPQLCSQGSNAVLTDILREPAADPETYVVQT